MAKKAKGGKGKAKKGGGDKPDAPGGNPAELKDNYVKMCKAIGIQANQKVIDAIVPASEEDQADETQLIVDNELGPLGPGGTRALTCALLGGGPERTESWAAGLAPGPYYKLKTLRIWRCNIGDDGAVAVAEFLKGGGNVNVSFLELMDNKIGARGAAALGEALCCMPDKNGIEYPTKLVTLKLDYNNTLGSEGVTELCRGLRSNTVLKQLHVPYCKIDSEGAVALKQAIGISKTLALVNLQGNYLRSEGLRHLADGIRRSKGLTTLNLSDNQITGGTDAKATEALTHFARALQVNQVLANINLMFNAIGIQGALALKIALTKENERIKTFLVDSTLPDEIFQTLFRADAGGGKKKGKKGKKKKK